MDLRVCTRPSILHVVGVLSMYKMDCGIFSTLWMLISVFEQDDTFGHAWLRCGDLDKDP